MIRSAVLAAVLAAATTPVLAQTAGQAAPIGETRSLSPVSRLAAAATLPNSFDGSARPVTPAPPTAVPSGPTQDEVTQADMAEGTLRVVIADLADGELDATLFTTDLADRLRPQLPTLRPVVQGFGALELIEPQGVSNGANQFLVVFENAATQWIIGLNEAGLVSALLFRPAPAVSSEPEPSGPAAAAPGTAVRAPQTRGQTTGDES